MPYQNISVMTLKGFRNGYSALSAPLNTLRVTAYLLSLQSRRDSLCVTLFTSLVLVTVFTVGCHLGMWPSITLGDVQCSTFQNHALMDTGTLLSQPCAGLQIAHYNHPGVSQINMTGMIVKIVEKHP